MNIQNRLKKLQNQIIGNDSEFCDCEKEPHITVIIPTADGTGQTIDGKPYKEPPEFCPACHKPNLETIRTTFVIKPPEENQQ
jgi:hypothetical protein